MGVVSPYFPSVETGASPVKPQPVFYTSILAMPITLPLIPVERRLFKKSNIKFPLFHIILSVVFASVYWSTT